VYVTLQVPAEIVQVVELNVPVLLVVNAMEPVGVPVLVVTVAVQLVATLSRTLAGEHETVVVVAVTPWVTASRNVPVLPVWTLSPP
jgi:hypothetical protein